MSVTINGTSGVVFNDSSTQNTAATGFGFKNRIINGGMVIDQRSAGSSTSVQTTTSYPSCDRWQVAASQNSKFSIQQNAASVTPPVGFSSYLGITSSSAYSVLTGDFFAVYQRIEGFNTFDLALGTASAATVTLSFWVRSSLTGTFGGVLQNGAQNRSYPFTYTISAANTWEQKSVTVAGDTSGTWVGATNGVGLQVTFGLGVGTTYSGTASAWGASNYISATGATSVVGTNGATFYITGVQLEAGSTASPFEYRSYGTELALCQRYYENSYPAGIAVGSATPTFSNGYGISITTSDLWGSTSFKVPKRATPTVSIYGSNTGTINKVRQATTSTEVTCTSPSWITTLAFTDIGSSAAFSVSYPASQYDFMWTASSEL